MNEEIFIKHHDWSGICKIEKNKIFRNDFPEENGSYIFYINKLIIIWDKWGKEDFYYIDSKYVSKKIFLRYSLIKYNNNLLHIILPNKLYINNHLLFSNITLCKNKIILTSNYYHDNEWNINKIKIKLFYNNNLINYKKNIYKNTINIETSLNIILEVEEYYENISIEILYDDDRKEKKYNFFLEQFIMQKFDFCAMTLFKDDYPLLNQYIKYYDNLGIHLFFLYYNSKIDIDFIDKLKQILNYFTNITLYLIEWDYPYFITSKNYFLKKQHHSQTMAINDSLHILKNYVNYTLYNDLDEYIELDYPSFYYLISDNKDIDIFVFKNQFCKMGNELIQYKDFYHVFDKSKIIYGNYWLEKREKNLVKLENIDIMGVHNSYTDYVKIKNISKFYHFINFKEKNREDLMNNYVIHL